MAFSKSLEGITLLKRRSILPIKINIIIEYFKLILDFLAFLFIIYSKYKPFLILPSIQEHGLCPPYLPHALFAAARLQ